MGKNILVIAALLVSGCSADGYVIQNAIKACEQHQGVHSLYSDMSAWHVQCNDGELATYMERRRGGKGAADGD